MSSTVAWKLARIRQRLAAAKDESGFRGLGEEALQLTRELSSVPLALGSEWFFDMRRGIRTRGFVRNQETLVPQSIGGDPEYYQPMGLRSLRQVVSTLPVDPAGTTFVDLGAGRGRALILAAELGFRRVVGVELDGQLVHQARENIRRWRVRSRPTALPGQQIDIVHGDAATFPLPDGPLFISLFNPFGPATLRMLLSAVCASSRPAGDETFLAYINPVHADTFDDFADVPLHARGVGWSAYRWEPLVRP